MIIEEVVVLEEAADDDLRFYVLASLVDDCLTEMEMADNG